MISKKDNEVKILHFLRCGSIGVIRMAVCTLKKYGKSDKEGNKCLRNWENACWQVFCPHAQ